jgi:ribonuclease P protein component
LIRATDSRGKGARRLEGTHAYAPVFAFKCRVVGEQFQVYGKPNERGVARLGIVVSKQVMPRAVDRNYCKRFVREVFRQEHELLHGFDFVVRPRSGKFPLPAAARAELRELLLNVLRKCRGRNPAVDYG